MRQYVHCNGCSSQLPIPEPSAEEPSPRFIHCENCGQAIFWDGEISDQHQAAPLPDSKTLELDSPPELELEIEPENEPETEEIESPGNLEQPLEGDGSSSTDFATDWSILNASAPPRRRKETSAIRKIIPPILGGLAAFPIATMIMWYGFGRDIGSTGPTVAQYVPWIVPEKLRDLPRDFSRQARTKQATPGRLPSLNRPSPTTSSIENSVASNENLVSPKPSDAIRSSDPSERTETVESQPSKAQPSEEEILDASLSMSQTIAKLQTLQNDWASTPKDNRAMQLMMIGRYCTEIKRLSQQSSELKGRSGAVWWKEIDSLARGILSHPNLPIVIQHSATGKWPDVPASSPNEFLATTVKISDGNDPQSNSAWLLKETWQYGDKVVKIEVLPGAWRKGIAPQSEQSNATALIFGKLVADEESNTPAGLKLKAHAIFVP